MRTRPLLGIWALLGITLGACGAGPRTATTTERPLPQQPPGSRHCGAIGEGTFTEAPLRVLDDHLILRGPSGMAIVPPRGRPRGAASPDESETRLRVTDNEQTWMLVVATELYRSPGEDVETRIRSWLGEEAFELENLSTTGLDVFFVSTEAAADDHMALVARALVVSPDDTMQHVAFFVPERDGEAESASSCTAVARRIASTLAPGSRRLDSAGGRQVLRSGIAIDLPPGYVALRRMGRGFEVHYFYRLVPLGGPHGQLGVYLGYEPRTHVGEVLEMHSVAGAMLGQSVRWSAWTTAVRGQRIEHMETMMEVPGQEGLHAHAFFVAEAPELAVELKEVAETLFLVGEVAE